MSFIKNTEIASQYRVSSTTVLNWIADGVAKKNNLIVELFGAKYKIIDNAHNRSVLLNLSSNALIYRNKIEVKKTKINPELYNYFNQDQLIELINKLEINRTVPLKFSYLGGKGANAWDNFVKTAEIEGGYSPTVKIPQLLRKSHSLILDRIPKGKKINIVDIGAGSSQSMMEITDYFNSRNLLNKYIGVDINKQMLDKSKGNILKVDASIDYVYCVLDFEKADFAENLFNQKDENTINLMFFVEGTVGNAENLNRTLENLKLSLGNDDVFIVTNVLDTVARRTQVSLKNITKPHIWLTEYLGIDIESSELKTIYDKESHKRKGYLVLDKDYEIEFEINKKSKIVKLYKDQELYFWYHKMTEKANIFNELDQAGLTLLDFTTTSDHSFFLAICQAVR